MEVKNILSLATRETVELIRIELTEDELAVRKTELAKNLIRLGELKDELDVAKERFKLASDPIKSRNAELLGDVRLGFTDVRMNVANIPDEERNIVEFYNPETGKKVGVRQMTKDERTAIKFPQKQF